MMKTKVTTFIPFGKVDSFGDIIHPNCKITIAPGIKILESHRSEDGITIVTKMEMSEISIIPKTFGFNIF